MNFEKSVAEVLSVMKSYSLVKQNVTDGEIQEFMNEIISSEKDGNFVEPLSLFHNFTFIKGVWIQEYDDCNTYQEEGYYKNILDKLSRYSDGKISFTDIEENWDNIEDVKLSFTYQGKSKTLSMNVIEEHDMVPSNFIEMMKEILKNVDGEYMYITADDEFGPFYFYVPKEPAIKLMTIKNEYYKHLRDN